MNVNEIQQQLFGHIKTKTTDNGLLAEEIAKLLEISTDSAYRRINGQKTIQLDELYKLCVHYKISLDQLMNLQQGVIVFHGQYLDRTTFRFEEYMTSLMHNMAFINSHKEKELYYICKDLPIFHHFVFREIAAFKWFFWLKTYFQFPEFANKKFKVGDYPQELFAIDQKVLSLYNQIPSIEIWNIETMNIIFRQIEFYRDGQVFESDEDALRLYEIVGKLWDHLEEQAALGYKFTYGDTAKKPISDFKMYFNEVLLGDNNIFMILDGQKLTYMTHTTINFMMTRDIPFNENLYKHIQNMMKRSTLISSVSEKERSRFFRITRDKINNRKQSLRQKNPGL
jgi:plasmid maintenance system antidote protein VapI